MSSAQETSGRGCNLYGERSSLPLNYHPCQPVSFFEALQISSHYMLMNMSEKLVRSQDPPAVTFIWVAVELLWSSLLKNTRFHDEQALPPADSVSREGEVELRTANAPYRLGSLKAYWLSSPHIISRVSLANTPNSRPRCDTNPVSPQTERDLTYPQMAGSTLLLPACS